jgi:hypothetical protein
MAAEETEQVSADRLSTIRAIAGRSGGRPIVNRSNEEVRELNQSNAWKTQERMQARVLNTFGKFGEEGAVSEDALMAALVAGKWLPTVWESREVWALRMSWVDELKDVLRNVWTPTLTFELRDALSISYDKLDELRQKLALHRVGKSLLPRPWVINP